MKLKARAYITYEKNPSIEQWTELELLQPPFSSIDNCFQWIRRTYPNAQIKLEWTYKESNATTNS